MTSSRSKGRSNILYPGARMDQEKFHLLYCEMPENYRAELIGGVVFEPPPPGIQHAEGQPLLAAAFLSYGGRTKGLQVLAPATLILSNLDEVEPDVVLRIRPEFGGKSGTVKKRCSSLPSESADYVEGAPELVAEIAFSSRKLDLSLKKERYRITGVIEYLVVDLIARKIRWFDLKNGTEFKSDRFGVLSSKVFPGLRIHQEALLQHDYELLMHTVESGMHSPEYKEFTSKLLTKTSNS